MSTPTWIGAALTAHDTEVVAAAFEQGGMDAALAHGGHKGASGAYHYTSGNAQRKSRDAKKNSKLGIVTARVAEATTTAARATKKQIVAKGKVSSQRAEAIAQRIGTKEPGTSRALSHGIKRVQNKNTKR